LSIGPTSDAALGQSTVYGCIRVRVRLRLRIRVRVRVRVSNPSPNPNLHGRNELQPAAAARDTREGRLADAERPAQVVRVSELGLGLGLTLTLALALKLTLTLTVTLTLTLTLTCAGGPGE